MQRALRTRSRTDKSRGHRQVTASVLQVRPAVPCCHRLGLTVRLPCFRPIRLSAKSSLHGVPRWLALPFVRGHCLMRVLDAGKSKTFYDSGGSSQCSDCAKGRFAASPGDSGGCTVCGTGVVLARAAFVVCWLTLARVLIDSYSSVTGASACSPVPLSSLSFAQEPALSVVSAAVYGELGCARLPRCAAR